LWREGWLTSAGWKIGAEVLVAPESFLCGVHIEITRQGATIVLQDGLAIADPDRAIGMNTQS
jgi:hypothetical protein